MDPARVGSSDARTAGPRSRAERTATPAAATLPPTSSPTDAEVADTILPRLRRLAARLVPGQDVDDLLQDTLHELLLTDRRWRAEGHSPQSLLAVALTICRRRAGNLHRRRGRGRLVLLDDWAQQASPATADIAHSGLLPPEDATWHALGRRQRRIVAIVLAGGTADDCAAALGLPRKEVHRVMRQIGERCTSRRAERRRALFHTRGDSIAAPRPHASLPGAEVG
ncbi:MAG: hypothetical protein ACK501_16570 [Planctomycetota bacterium]|jgi:DNA-directed RNA polymerase specialized sigma24 family protein